MLNLSRLKVEGVLSCFFFSSFRYVCLCKQQVIGNLPVSLNCMFGSPSGRYSDQFIMDFYSKELNSKPCQNQGFVLDGFPKTYEQAKQLLDGE